MASRSEPETLNIDGIDVAISNPQSCCFLQRVTLAMHSQSAPHSALCNVCPTGERRGNCHGDAASSTADAGAAACSLADGDASGFGAPCRDDSECTCAANYCALMPGQAQGYCSKTGCDTAPTLCPTDWTCFDLSMFVPGQPAICTK